MKLTIAEQALFDSTGLLPQMTCDICSERKPITAFGGNRRGGRRETCRKCFKERSPQDKVIDSLISAKQRSIAYRQRRRHANQAYVRAIKLKTPCTDCGRVLQPRQMEFDHVRLPKVDSISNMTRYATLEQLKLEIAKCELTCAHCHRTRTTKREEAARTEADHAAIEDAPASVLRLPQVNDALAGLPLEPRQHPDFRKS